MHGSARIAQAATCTAAGSWVVVEANTDRAWINAIEDKGVSVVKAA